MFAVIKWSQNADAEYEAIYFYFEFSSSMGCLWTEALKKHG